MSDLIETIENGICTLTMNRPEARNAMSGPMMEAMAKGVARAAADREVRCLVITGAGGAFCAGGDVKGFASDSSKWLAKFATVLCSLYDAPECTGAQTQILLQKHTRMCSENPFPDSPHFPQTKRAQDILTLVRTSRDDLDDSAEAQECEKT